MEFLELLLILLIVGAIIALEVRDLLSAVVALGAVGLGLAVVFLILQAPDVAITQLAVEIIAVILLIRATIRVRLDNSPSGGRLVGALLGILFTGFFVAFAVPGFGELPPFGEPLVRVSQNYLDRGLAETGSANLVTSVILDYRAYDTLGEATILFAAVIGVSTLMRLRGRKEAEEK
jgi:multisubunit Na+/H+ antiporter MnhB subunit